MILKPGTWRVAGKRKLSPYDPASNDLFAEMAPKPDTDRKVLLDAAIRTMKEGDAWSNVIDCLYVMGAHAVQPQRINWVRPGEHTLTPVGTGTVDFVVDRGAKSDGATLYTSGFNPTTAAGHLTLNSAHLGVWLQENTGIAGIFSIGNLNTTFIPRQLGNTAQVRVNTGTLGSLPGTPAAAYNHFCADRDDSATTDYIADGVVRVADFASASSSLSNMPMAVLGRQTASTPTYQYDTRRQFAAHWGGHMTAEQHAALYSALDTLAVAIGAR